jgi:hypothetical protein
MLWRVRDVWGLQKTTLLGRIARIDQAGKYEDTIHGSEIVE